MATSSGHIPKIIVIVGETASGKSALALRLAELFSGEIISADAWAVYKDFDIGTAKPSGDDLRIPHHLVSVVEPSEGFNAAIYKDMASEVITEIDGRKKLPIVVGGTGLYIDSLLYDYSFLPANPDRRRELNEKNLEQLQAEIASKSINIDGIDLRNKRRLVRLLENEGVRPKRDKLRQNTLIIGLAVSRDELKMKITTRVDQMLKLGLSEEVEQLSRRYSWDTEPMKGIGYKEFRAYIEGAQTLEETRDRLISSTLNLAKKQRTWFTRNKSIHWVTHEKEAVDLVTTFMNK